MLISICIPHYNRCKYLIKVLESIRKQDYPEIEVIISDDCSTDDSSKMIPQYIKDYEGTCRARFRYIRQNKNLGYDANLRVALAAGEGEYLFILGNDDALPPRSRVITRLMDILKSLDFPEVAFSTIEYYGNENQRVRRVKKTSLVGSGPDVAIRTFRSFSMAMGIIIKRSAFIKHDTDAYDNSIFTQVYLAARVIASGGRLAVISESLVAKDVRFPGERVNSYLDVLARDNRKFQCKTGGLDQVGRLACEAILPYVSSEARGKYLFFIYGQILSHSYPYWLYDYRKNGVYRAAVNLALGCWPFNLVKVRNVPLIVYVKLCLLYFLVTILDLLLPVRLLEIMKQIISGSSNYRHVVFDRMFRLRKA